MKIERELIEELLAISKDNYPYEFVALLTGKKDVIKNYYFLPGTKFGLTSASFDLNMMPLGRKILGTYHSHPSPNNRPSNQDLQMFAHNGNYHIIAGYPYSETSWRCYDKKGAPTNLEVVESEPEKNIFENGKDFEDF